MHVKTSNSVRSLFEHKRWIIIGLAVSFVALSVQYQLKIINSRSTRSAILRWRPQLHELREGVNIWHHHNYPNPPIMAILLQPFAVLPNLVCSMAWFYAKVAMTLLAFYWVRLMVRSDARPFPSWANAVVFFLSIRPVISDLTHGNVNLFILFLVVAALYAFHNRREVSSGLLLALAIACKVTPALFVPYFIWKRAWKTLAGCIAGLVLFLWLIPGLFLGMKENTLYFETWVERMVKPFVVDGEVTSEHNNQSLPGLAHRLLTHSPSFSDYVNDIYVPLRYHNIADWNPESVRWLMKGCMLLFALLVIWTCRTPMAARPTWRFAAEFSIIVIGMLLFSERTWKHHCVTLVLPFAVLVYYLLMFHVSRFMKTYLIGSIAAATLLMTSTVSGVFPNDERFSELAQTYGAFVWAYLVLLAAVVVVLLKRETPKSEV